MCISLVFKSAVLEVASFGRRDHVHRFSLGYVHLKLSDVQETTGHINNIYMHVFFSLFQIFAFLLRLVKHEGVRLEFCNL